MSMHRTLLAFSKQQKLCAHGTMEQSRTQLTLHPSPLAWPPARRAASLTCLLLVRAPSTGPADPRPPCGRPRVELPSLTIRLQQPGCACRPRPCRRRGRPAGQMPDVHALTHHQVTRAASWSAGAEGGRAGWLALLLDCQVLLKLQGRLLFLLLLVSDVSIH